MIILYNLQEFVSDEPITYTERNVELLKEMTKNLTGREGSLQWFTWDTKINKIRACWYLNDTDYILGRTNYKNYYFEAKASSGLLIPIGDLTPFDGVS